MSAASTLGQGRVEISRTIAKSMVACTIALLLFPCSQALAQNVLSLRSSSLWSDLQSLDAHDQYVFCAIGPGIQVYDFTDATQPLLISRTLLTRRPCSLDYENGYLYVGLQDSGAVIFDASDPQHLAE